MSDPGERSGPHGTRPYLCWCAAEEQKRSWEQRHPEQARREQAFGYFAELRRIEDWRRDQKYVGDSRRIWI